MQRIQQFVAWAGIIAQLSHVFCCVLPTLFSVMSFLAGVGLLAAMPTGLMALHEAMHSYESPIIIFSGLMIVTGWVLHFIAIGLDCRSTGCGHEPCKPKKKRSEKVLVVASLIFIVNISIYMAWHNVH